MRKIFLLLAMVSTAAFTGCTDDDEVIYEDYDTYPRAIQLNIVDLGFEPSTERYEYLVDFREELYPADVALVYRQTIEGNFTVWQQIPRTLYLSGGGEVDYDFNFTRNDLLIYADATFNLESAPEFTQNQTFRIVLVPADFISNTRIDLNNYELVAEKLGIRESEVKMLQ